MATATLLDVRGVQQSYHKGGGVADLVVLDGVDLSIARGEVVGLLGRSGSGKSTLLRIIAGLLAPSGGTVAYQGRAVTGPSEGVAMVFQSFALFPWLTVLENVELGLEAKGVAKAERRKRAVAAIDLIGLDGFESAYPKELSGGMRQRVGLARALVVHPDLLLMDEPFSALDVLTAETLRTDLIDLWTDGKLPIGSILMVTHNIEEAVLMCDRVLVFASNPGRIRRELAIRLPHPRNRLDPQFRSLVNEIYRLMTQRGAAVAAPAGGLAGEGVGLILPEVSTNLVAGLIEAVAAPPSNGEAALPELAQSLYLELDELFPIAEVLQLLRLGEMAEGRLRLTPDGRRFADMDTDARKKLFGALLVQHVPLVGLIRRVLDERPTHRARLTRFAEELEDHMSEDYAEETLRAVIDWGRFAEAFSYDEQTETFSLENPV